MMSGHRILLIALLCLAPYSVSATTISTTIIPDLDSQPVIRNVFIEISPASRLKAARPVPVTQLKVVTEDLATKGTVPATELRIAKKIDVEVLDETTLIPLIKIENGLKTTKEFKDGTKDLATENASKNNKRSSIGPTIPVTTTESTTPETKTTEPKPTEPPTTRSSIPQTTGTETESTSGEPTSPTSFTTRPTLEPTTTTEKVTTTLEPTATPEPYHHHHLTKGEIAAVVIFTLILVTIISAGIVYIIRRRRMSNDPDYRRLV